MKDYQKALDYLTKLERADSFIRTGDVVPHPASDLLQNLLNYFKNNKLDLNDDLYKKQSTFKECIEKWKNKNFIVNDQLEQYQYITISSKNFDMEDIFIYISAINNVFEYSLDGHLNRELCELLLETIKALEVENG